MLHNVKKPPHRGSTTIVPGLLPRDPRIDGMMDKYVLQKDIAEKTRTMQPAATVPKFISRHNTTNTNGRVMSE